MLPLTGHQPAMRAVSLPAGREAKAGFHQAHKGYRIRKETTSKSRNPPLRVAFYVIGYSKTKFGDNLSCTE